jgi:hypothetical protein
MPRAAASGRRASGGARRLPRATSFPKTTRPEAVERREPERALPYEDFLLHAIDVWAAQLGVPVRADLWAQGVADSTAGLQRAAPAIPLSEIQPYVVNVGNNGELSGTGNTSRSNSHGGFLSDPDTLNSVLYRVLGAELRRPLTVRGPQY